MSKYFDVCGGKDRNEDKFLFWWKGRKPEADKNSKIGKCLSRNMKDNTLDSQYAV